MSKFVLVSDIHGNAMALSAVIGEISSDDTLVVLGDIHGLNSMPILTETMVNTHADIALAGNHDKAIFHHNEGHVNDSVLSKFEHDHTLNSLTDTQIEWMRSLPYMNVWQDGDSRIAAAHAIPWPEKASGYEQGNAGVSKGDVPHYASIVADDYDWVFLGHTHEQYDLDASKFGHSTHFVNPGSLGYDGTYSVVDTDSGEVEHRSVEWDHDALKQHVQSLLPDGAPHVESWL